MKAVVHDRYGPPEVLHLEEVERPVPADHEVLIRVHATTVTRTDCAFLRAEPWAFYRFYTGLRRPKRRTLGTEVAGVVEAVGRSVTEFAVGDPVFGVNAGRFGAHAEFVCMPERGALAAKPPAMTFEEAAAVCDGGILALWPLRRTDLRPGRRILVNGASGSMGTAGVQLARHFGADVTAVCGTKNVELVRALGADRVIDYQREDFLRNDETYDVVFDAVGKRSFRECRSSLASDGMLVATDGLRNVLLSVTTRVGRQRVVFPIPPRYTKKDVLFLRELIERGEYRAVIDRTYPLAMVVEATRYVETGQKTGNVVLTVVGEGSR